MKRKKQAKKRVEVGTEILSATRKRGVKEAWPEEKLLHKINDSSDLNPMESPAENKIEHNILEKIKQTDGS